MITSMNKKKKLLIFFNTSDAEEKEIPTLLKGISEDLFRQFFIEILIIEGPINNTKKLKEAFNVRNTNINSENKITVLQNPKNQGYGGTQKLGYEYAIRNQFDIIALMNGNDEHEQYAPELILELVNCLFDKKADAVFGFTMVSWKDILKKVRPIFRFIGKRGLSFIQNRILKSNLSEFYPAYKVYRVAALEEVPFRMNSDDFHFDMEIIIQLLTANKKIFEFPLPAFYGEDFSRVHWIKHTKDILICLQFRFHKLGIGYHRKFDFEKEMERYDLKLGYQSSHSMTIDSIPIKAKVADIGCGRGLIAQELMKKGCQVIGIDKKPPIPENVTKAVLFDLNEKKLPGKITSEIASCDYIIALDIIEHLISPEAFLNSLSEDVSGENITLIFTTPNIAFFLIRIALLFGRFGYGREGILDFTHTRLFSFPSFKELLNQNGFEVEKALGIPAPFPKVIRGRLGRFLLWLNIFLIRINKELFSYQIFIEATAKTTLNSLLQKKIKEQ